MQPLWGTQPLPGRWTNGPGTALPRLFGAVTQKGRESGQGRWSLCPVNNAWILLRSGSLGLPTGAGWAPLGRPQELNGREHGPWPPLEAGPEASTLNPRGPQRAAGAVGAAPHPVSDLGCPLLFPDSLLSGSSARQPWCALPQISASYSAFMSLSLLSVMGS